MADWGVVIAVVGDKDGGSLSFFLSIVLLPNFWTFVPFLVNLDESSRQSTKSFVKLNVRGHVLALKWPLFSALGY